MFHTANIQGRAKSGLSSPWSAFLGQGIGDDTAPAGKSSCPGRGCQPRGYLLPLPSCSWSRCVNAFCDSPSSGWQGRQQLVRGALFRPQLGKKKRKNPNFCWGNSSPRQPGRGRIPGVHLQQAPFRCRALSLHLHFPPCKPSCRH